MYSADGAAVAVWTIEWKPEALGGAETMQTMSESASLYESSPPVLTLVW